MDVDVVEFLIEKGANGNMKVHFRGVETWTPLEVILISECEKLVDGKEIQKQVDAASVETQPR
jgi:hypothetical protein